MTESESQITTFIYFSDHFFNSFEIQLFEWGFLKIINNHNVIVLFLNLSHYLFNILREF